MDLTLKTIVKNYPELKHLLVGAYDNDRERVEDEIMRLKIRNPNKHPKAKGKIIPITGELELLL